jgi:hypothetical protein
MKTGWPRTKKEQLKCFRDTREAALRVFPQHLTDALLAMPEDAREELCAAVDGMLYCLTEWADENNYCIPEGPPTGERPEDDSKFTRGDLEDIRYEWRCIANLLEVESKYR